MQELRFFLCPRDLKLVTRVWNFSHRFTIAEEPQAPSVWWNISWCVCVCEAVHAEACVWMAAVLSGPWSSGWCMTIGGCNVEHGPHLLFSSGMCRGAGVRIWNILICCWDCCFHVFVALISQTHRIKKKCLSFVVGYETVFLFWYRFKQNVQGSLKMHSQCCIVGNFALFWISAQYIPLFTFFRFPANDFSRQTWVISCLGSNYSTDMKRKCCFFVFF